VTTALHAYDDADAATLAQLSREQSRDRALSMAPRRARAMRAIDPETVARQYLDQAVRSDATPAITAPRLGAATSEFKSLGSETVL
jgi:bacillolysin/neutral peptidase B